ncbi:hypothetical protein [Alcanivorax sp. 1008]|nr:hypothetical protein [Alcanivorax sp. 1008]MCC1497628.1 hypothetical protein [Alcanivorax sp. 1008]
MKSVVTTSDPAFCSLTGMLAGMDAGAIAMIRAFLYGTERFERSFEQDEL